MSSLYTQTERCPKGNYEVQFHTLYAVPELPKQQGYGKTVQYEKYLLFVYKNQTPIGHVTENKRLQLRAITDNGYNFVKDR